MITIFMILVLYQLIAIPVFFDDGIRFGNLDNGISSFLEELGGPIQMWIFMTTIRTTSLILALHLGLFWIWAGVNSLQLLAYLIVIAVASYRRR